MKRKATAVWNGSGKEGKGLLSTQSTVLKNTQYSFSSRFEEEIGTNPEELIAAAHAGCFAMKLSFLLDAEGFSDKKLNATARVSLEDGSLTKSEITLEAQVPGIDASSFENCVKEAELNCPISKALNLEISVDIKLNT